MRIRELYPKDRNILKIKNYLSITNNTREILSKQPKKILDSEEFLEKIKNRKFYLICVGDMVTLTAIKNGIIPNLAIFDGKTERKRIDSNIIEKAYKKIVKVKNPPGKITKNLLVSIIKILNRQKNEKNAIKVEGEEDLAAPLCIAFSKTGTFIAWGVPKKGIALLKVSKAKKEHALRILMEMESF
ncbi:MAG: GTP-dependent dephospho-CoA kinase family protein [Candidatus Parvarchaeum sp.]